MDHSSSEEKRHPQPPRPPLLILSFHATESSVCLDHKPYLIQEAHPLPHPGTTRYCTQECQPVLKLHFGEKKLSAFGEDSTGGGNNLAGRNS